MLSGREETVGKASDEAVVKGAAVVGKVGVVGVGSIREAIPPARSQGFGGEPIRVYAVDATHGVNLAN